MPQLILSHIDQRIATLTFNRPAKLNALSYELIDRLMNMLDELEDDPDVGAVILTGSGRAFSAGADIHQFFQSVKKGPALATKQFVRRGQTMTARLENYPKPIIAAVNGLAFGGGCEITEAVHLAIASDKAIFAKPEINLAMPPTFGGTQRLARLAGRKRALQHLLAGAPFSPPQALDMGLINQIVRHEDLLECAQKMAQDILRYSPLAISSILSAVTRGLNTTIEQGLLIEREQFTRMAPTHDLSEGLEAWMARRSPQYNGR